MNQSEKARIAKLLQQSLPPVTNDGAKLGRDLWPAMLQRLEQPAPAPWLERAGFERDRFERDRFKQAWFNQAWFDWALGAAAAAWLVFFPAAIPVLLYHL
jgi:hypothetical protein